MSRLIALVLAGAVLAVAVGTGDAGAATNEIKLCGEPNGWTVGAGNLPPRLPNTSCSFARDTYRALRERDALTNAPSRLRVSGTTLRCTDKSSSSYSEVRCKSSSKFVLVYKFR